MNLKLENGTSNRLRITIYLFTFQEELSSKDLFHAVYGKKILRDFKEGKLDDDGNSAEPSEDENMTRDEAWVSESSCLFEPSGDSLSTDVIWLVDVTSDAPKTSFRICPVTKFKFSTGKGSQDRLRHPPGRSPQDQTVGRPVVPEMNCVNPTLSPWKYRVVACI